MLETERLILRRFRAGDWRDLHEYLSDEAVVRFEPYGVFTEEESRREAARRAGDECFWAVCLKENGKLIGNLYFARQDPVELETWELGYVFNAKYQGKGYATEAARALVGDSFRAQNARRVIAMCNPLNERSWRLLERLGMRREGHLRQNIWFKKNTAGQPIWVDTYEYAILASEWAERAQ